MVKHNNHVFHVPPRVFFLETNDHCNMQSVKNATNTCGSINF